MRLLSRSICLGEMSSRSSLAASALAASKEPLLMPA
jgi:hypothetical protein